MADEGRPPLKREMGATVPVLEWHFYNRTRAGKGNVGDIDALCRAVIGAGDYLPAEFDGMSEEIVRLLREWNRVASRSAKLDADLRLVQRFDKLRAEGATVTAACDQIASEHSVQGTRKGVEAALTRARRRLERPIFEAGDD